MRPCGIGSSTSNLQDQCLSGTLGFVGRNSAGQKFLVSNWHVWADLAGAIGDDVLQPSRGDNACLLLSSDSIGQVTDKEEILFNGSANRIDLAVASMSTVAGQDAVSGSTPADGYGSPGSSPRSVLVGDTVRKYGRTTRQTSGKVFSVNSTVTVNYGGGRVALFTGQIGIRDAGGPFCRPGDSGSLVVDSHNNPVGLLFAGGGGTTFANPIREVLSRTGLTVVGATPPPDPAPGGGTASVGDRVFFDANGNGRADANELGVQNVSVTLYSAGGDGRFGGTDDRRLAMVRTNAAGRYRFSNLSAGAYYLRFGLIAGYQFTKQDAGSDAVDSDADPAGYTNVFVLTDGQTDLTRDAGLVSTAVRGNGGGNGNGRDGGVAPPPDNDQGRNGRGGRTGGRSPAPPPPGGGDHDNGGRDGSGGRSPSTPESPGGGEGGDSGSGGGERRGGRRGGRG